MLLCHLGKKKKEQIKCDFNMKYYKLKKFLHCISVDAVMSTFPFVLWIMSPFLKSTDVWTARHTPPSTSIIMLETLQIEIKKY